MTILTAAASRRSIGRDGVRLFLLCRGVTLLGQDVVQSKQLSRGVIPAWRLLLDANNIVGVDRRCLREDVVHLFQRTSRCLGEDPPRCDGDEEVDDGEDAVRLVADCGKCNGCNKHDLLRVRKAVSPCQLRTALAFGKRRPRRTMKLNSQFADVEIPLAAARMERGVISAG